MANSPARIRANRAYVNRQKALGLCSRGCKTPVVGRVNCPECTKRNNKRYRYAYKTLMQKKAIMIRKLTKIVELQNEVIAQLRERLKCR